MRSRKHCAQQGFPSLRAPKCDRGRRFGVSCWKGRKCERGGTLRDPESHELKRGRIKKFRLDPISAGDRGPKSKRKTKSRFRIWREAERLKKMKTKSKDENRIFTKHCFLQGFLALERNQVHARAETEKVVQPRSL